jgi:tRNA (mo5U34)-methyltransferase
MTSAAELQRQADAFRWYHTIDLGHGVVTKGMSVQETSADVLPEVAGKSVLDIGAWDGKFSFLAEQRGADRVVALDHYAWGVDFAARGAYWAECIHNGTLPDQSRDESDFWQAELPGQGAFNFAKGVLGSRVEAVVGDFQRIDLAALGRFDVVLYLGVLYHMKEPLTCLERLHAVTKEVAVIETEAVHLHGLDHEALLQFHAGSSLQTDFGNWYVPTIQALHNLCRAAGFSRVSTVVGPPALDAAADPAQLPGAVGPGLMEKMARRRRGAPATPAAPTSAPSQHYRAVVHAFT